MAKTRGAVKDDVSLKDRLVKAAGKILVEEGYDKLSMRRVAQEVNCSQMAMYRHFSNKEALTQHLCAELYKGFTERMDSEMQIADAPWDRIRIFISSLLKFAVKYPDHYSLIFLERNADAGVIAERERLGAEFLKNIHDLIRQLLPPDTPYSVSDTRLRQMIACLHGTAALLIAHPKAYSLTLKKALIETEEAFCLLLQRVET